MHMHVFWKYCVIVVGYSSSLTTSMSALPSLYWSMAFIHASFVALYYVVYMHALRIRFLPYPSCCLPLGSCRNLKGKWGNIIRKFVGTLFIHGLV
jgi:hypothetical protein